MNGDQIVWLHWPETLSFLLLLFGIFLALALQNPVLNYAVMFLAGFLSGQMIYFNQAERPLFPIILLILGFFAGFLVGSLGTNRVVLTILFVCGNYIAYALHQKGILPLFKYEPFVKG